ncbi:hypothetical protein ACFLWH_01955 [Chloroflexota bacterium]
MSQDKVYDQDWLEKELQLNQLNIPVSFALEHLFNIAIEFCAYMTVIKNPEEAQARKVSQTPESYVGYSRDDKFRKISSAGATLPIYVTSVLKRPTSVLRIAMLVTQIGLRLPPSFRKVLRPVYLMIFERDSNRRLE